MPKPGSFTWVRFKRSGYPKVSGLHTETSSLKCISENVQIWGVGVMERFWKCEISSTVRRKTCYFKWYLQNFWWVDNSLLIQIDVFDYEYEL